MLDGKGKVIPLLVLYLSSGVTCGFQTLPCFIDSKNMRYEILRVIMSPISLEKQNYIADIKIDFKSLVRCHIQPGPLSAN